MTWIVEAFAIIGVLIVGIVIANFLWLLFMAVKGHLMTKLCTSLEEDLTVKYGTWASKYQLSNVTLFLFLIKGNIVLRLNYRVSLTGNTYFENF